MLRVTRINVKTAWEQTTYDIAAAHMTKGRMRSETRIIPI